MANPGHDEMSRVYLVGAGPGDPGMITLRAIECLQLADVVLFDYLVNPAILKHVRADAEAICLGRHGHGRLWSQAEINARLVEMAGQGKSVVRLKSGDPAVFARGAEEAEYLVQHNVSFEIVPGITAALAAGSCAGIPITHRDLSSAVALVTGQEHADKETSALEFKALAKFPGTLVFYMGVTTAETWTKLLIDSGKSAATPTAIIRRCSFPDQQTIRCTLEEVAERLRHPKRIRPPAIIIVGEVASLGSTFSWFEKRPLFGKRILVTRPTHQAADLVTKLTQQGADVLQQPAIQISDPPNWEPVDDAIGRLEQFDWVVFSSSNGVKFFMNRLNELGCDSRKLGSVKLAIVGPGTSLALKQFHLRADWQPDEYRAEALAEALSMDAKGSKFLLIRASRGREVLAEQLRSAAGEVEQIVVYSSTDVEVPDSVIVERLDAGEIDWVTVTSSAIAHSLAALFGESLNKAKLASISPVTSQSLLQLGFKPAAEATEYTMDGVIKSILEKV